MNLRNTMTHKLKNIVNKRKKQFYSWEDSMFSLGKFCNSEDRYLIYNSWVTVTFLALG